MALFGWLSSRSNSCKCTRQSCRKRGAAGNWGCYVSPILWAPGVPKGCTAAALGCLDRVPASHGQSTLGLFLSICSPRGSRGAKIIIREGRHCREQAGVIYFLQPPTKAPRAAPAAQLCLADSTTSPSTFGCCSPPRHPKSRCRALALCFRGNNRYGMGSQRGNVLVLPLEFAFMRCRRLDLASPRHRRRLSALLPEECSAMGNLLCPRFPCPHNAAPSPHPLLGVPEPPAAPQTGVKGTHSHPVALRDQGDPKPGLPFRVLESLQGSRQHLGLILWPLWPFLDK